MQTKTIASIVAVAVVVVGGYFALSHKNIGDSASQNQNLASAVNAGKKISFSEFLKGGGTYKCNVKQYVGDIETNGTVYMNGDMIRGEYNTEVQGVKVDTSLVVRDGYTYTWNSMIPSMGLKIKAAASNESMNSETSGSYAFNAEQIGDYDCENWAVDATMFELPTGVNFQEI